MWQKEPRASRGQEAGGRKEAGLDEEHERTRLDGHARRIRASRSHLEPSTKGKRAHGYKTVRASQPRRFSLLPPSPSCDVRFLHNLRCSRLSLARSAMSARMSSVPVICPIPSPVVSTLFIILYLHFPVPF